MINSRKLEEFETYFEVLEREVFHEVFRWGYAVWFVYNLLGVVTLGVFLLMINLDRLKAYRISIFDWFWIFEIYFN